MLYCFTIEKTTFIPFDDERPLYTERKLSQMPGARSRKKKQKRHAERRNTLGASSVSSGLDSSTKNVNMALLQG